MAIVASRSLLLNAHACAGISASASSRASFRMARFLLGIGSVQEKHRHYSSVRLTGDELNRGDSKPDVVGTPRRLEAVPGGRAARLSIVDPGPAAADSRKRAVRIRPSLHR